MDNNDHDAITRLETKLETVCERTVRIEDKLDKLVNKCGDRVVDCSKKYVLSTTFYWIIGIIISGFGFLIGVLHNT